MDEPPRRRGAAHSEDEQNELSRAARGGMITLVGAGGSAAFGFAFNVLLAREIGPFGAGVVLQAIATFTIVVALTRVGLDTTAVWLLPRLQQTEPNQVPGAVIGLLVPATLVPAAAYGGWLLVRPFMHDRVAPGAVMDAMTLVLAFLPAASVMTVALACTRAFGGVLPFNLVGNLAVPAMRPIGLVIVSAAGGGALAAAAVWAVPWVLGMFAAIGVLAVAVRRFARGAEARWTPSVRLLRTIFGYSLPRMIMAAMEQTLIWVDVLLVGLLLGAAEAGVYGSAARFVAAGVVVITALRIVVAPQFSRLLAAQRKSEVQELYSVTARWILLFGAPVYILLAVYAPTVLSWLGPGFGSAWASTVILCVGSIVVVAAGNVQSLLLMSGGSLWGALNKTFVVGFNVGVNLLLVPRIGIEGAALAWAASMLLDTALAAFQVRRRTGIMLGARAVAATLLTIAVCVVLPVLLMEALWGQGTWQLLTSAMVVCATLLSYAVANRRRLGLEQLARSR